MPSATLCGSAVSPGRRSPLLPSAPPRHLALGVSLPCGIPSRAHARAVCQHRLLSASDSRVRPPHVFATGQRAASATTTTRARPVLRNRVRRALARPTRARIYSVTVCSTRCCACRPSLTAIHQGLTTSLDCIRNLRCIHTTIEEACVWTTVVSWLHESSVMDVIIVDIDFAFNVFSIRRFDEYAVLSGARARG